eukprot:9339113-Prorocentrum_lima.AAC.1
MASATLEYSTIAILGYRARGRIALIVGPGRARMNSNTSLRCVELKPVSIRKERLSLRDFGACGCDEPRTCGGA